MAKHVSLNFEDHSSLRVITDRSSEFGDNRMLAPVFPHEFRQVQANFPIVFVNEPQSDRYRPVALFGLEANENLFLSDSTWESIYLPLSVRMPPFSIGRGASNRLSVNIDLEHPRVSETRGEELFYSDGSHTPFLTHVSELLMEVHSAAEILPSFCAFLDEMQLIEPFTLEITLSDGSEGRLEGYYTVDEQKLQKLGGTDLEKLNDANYLMPTFMIVASLAHLSELIKRRDALLRDLLA